jgi:gamma-glutamyltranspeptidase/glutathione hydrolase
VSDDVRLPDLADVLERVAANGPDELTTGDTGRAISADVLERGGLLTVDDLAAYRPVVRAALSTRVGEWLLATNPPPSVGGVCVAAMLALLDGRPHGSWTPEDVEHVVRVQRAVLGHRLDVLEHAPDLAEAARAYLDQVDAEGLALLESGSTAQFSAVDAEGGACSLTVSSGYGSGMVARGTGIWLNNCLGEQELNPRGLHGLEPGTRLLSNMAPTVGRHADGGVLAIGSPGADRITTAITQVLAGFANGGLDLPAAIGHPRVHVHRAGRPEEDVKHEGFSSMYFGGVIAAQMAGDGSMNAAADPRREGAVRVVDGVH